MQDNGRNSSLPEQWFDSDHDPIMSALEIPFFTTGIRLALGDMALNGTFERHPDLKICVIELYGDWFPHFLKTLDHAYDFHGRVSGRPIRTLASRPSEYLESQVRLVPHWGLDDVPSLLAAYPGNIMFGGDYPHCEGLLSPYREYQNRIGPLAEPAAERLYGGNAAALLRLQP